MQENDDGKPTATTEPPWGWGPRAEISRLTGQTVLLAARLNRMLALSAELREMKRIGIPALAEPEPSPRPMPPPRR